MPFLQLSLSQQVCVKQMIYHSTDHTLVVTSSEESITDNCYSIGLGLNVTIEYISLYVDIQHTFRGDLSVNVRTWYFQITGINNLLAYFT